MSIFSKKKGRETVKDSHPQFTKDSLLTIIEESPNIIFINQRRRIVYANKRAEELMGYKKEELYAEDFNFMELIAPESKDLVKKNLKKHMEGRDVPPHEYKLLTRDRRAIFGLHTTKLIDFEGDKAILGIITDLTEQKKVEEEKIKLFNAIEILNEGVNITNNEGDIVYINEAYSNIFGYNKADLIGKHTSFIIPPEGKEALDKRLKVIQEKGHWKGEVLAKRRDGSSVSVHLTTALIKNKSGNPIGMVGIIRDITSYKEADKKMQEKIEELEKWQKHTVGREVKMVELKKEIKELKEKLKKHKPT
jgi:PAS domain S-box-containing protein